MMEIFSHIIENIGLIATSLLMGAVIPCGVLVALVISKKRKEVPFSTVFYGFGAFFASLLIVAVLALIVAQFFLPSITLNNESDADSYIFIGGAIVLALFYLSAEGIKIYAYKKVMGQEKNKFVGLTYGSGFVLAQNLLIFGLIYADGMDLSQSVVFGILMLISGVIYILISTIGYQMMTERFRYLGGALAVSYYLMFAVMLFFANIYVTYGFIVAVLIFNLIMGYVLLPLPFKRRKEA